jgi:dipeptidyl aminopeptidase/acylaminoacyl peptidase
MVNKYALLAACLAVSAAALAPALARAADIDYARVVEHTDAEVIVKRATLSTEAWFKCQFATRACASVPANTSVTVVEPTPAYMSAYHALMPSGASNLRRSPDGRYIAFYIPATQSRNTRTFGVMDTTNLSIYQKTEAVSYWDLLTEGIRYYVFSPDSKTMMYLDDAKGEPTLYRVNLAALSGTTLASEKMFSRKYSVADMLFTDDDTILFIANRDNPYAWALYQLSLDTYALTKVADNVSYAVNVEKAGNAYLFATADEQGVRPALYDPALGTVSYFDLPVKESLATEGKAVKLAKGLSGVFLLEKSRNSDTLIVWLHGGPYRQASDGYHPYLSYGGYDWVLERARQADIGVLKLDYPGSYGYGRAFAESITGRVGVKDAQDAHTAIVDFAKRNHYTRVYLMGNSYGGYLALKLLADNPSSYRGAFSIAGVADWLTLLTKLDTSIFNMQFLGTINDENRAAYQKASIYNSAGTLGTQKVILMHGNKDLTIPYSQSSGLATYLSSIGKNVQLISLENEDHVLKKPESFETLCRTAIAMTGKTSIAGCELP